MSDPAQLWADPRLVYTVAAAAIALLLVTIWLFRRRRREGRQAAVICLMLSIALHAALVFLVPLIPDPNGGSASVEPDAQTQAGIQSVDFSTFDPDVQIADASGETVDAVIAPLPVETLAELTEPSPPQPPSREETRPEERLTEETKPEEAHQLSPQPSPEELSAATDRLPESLHRSLAEIPLDGSDELFDAQLDNLLESAFAQDVADPIDSLQVAGNTANDRSDDQAAITEATSNMPSQPYAAAGQTASTKRAPASTVAGSVEHDFANRTGSAKQQALISTGGSAETEAAVEAALRFLAQAQRADGAWDPRATGAGKERAPLGMTRGGAGTRAETAITGLALLAMMGAGNTHHEGPYADNVYRGLAFAIRQQQPNGSLAGNASLYAANYSHGMAALAICEAAAITQDPSAVLSARRAIAHTRRMQHPSTGGWRYTENDPGDLSQLGWQAMVLDAGHRAGIPVEPRSIAGVQRFLRSVRMGSTGGLACYRPREAPSRTMTAEALATRLLIGETVPSREVAEAERYLLQQPPGVGQDNYYYWYYATLALHQLQDDAWIQWNTALKQRLLATQRGDGSWSADTLWGGYGGTVYTTSMAALCLESYYRHAVRRDVDRIANRPGPAVSGPAVSGPAVPGSRK